MTENRPCDAPIDPRATRKTRGPSSIGGNDVDDDALRDVVFGIDPTGDATRALTRLLRRVVARMSQGASEHDVDDLAQESLRRAIEAAPNFRGESRFTTWAIGVAARTVLTERRRRFAESENGRARAAAADDEARALKCPKTPSPDARSKKAEILAALRDGVATALTDRQRVAVVGELRGVSSVALASKLGLSRNALYKLVHDARKNLKRALLRRGFDAEAARDVLSEGRP